MYKRQQHRVPAGGGRPPRPAGYAVLRAGPVSLLVHLRSAAVACALALLLLAACTAALSIGRQTVPPAEVWAVVLGEPSRYEVLIGTLRLPRLVTGLLVGLALGAAGALIQTVARNPLASPDVIGVTHGAAAMTVGAMTFGLVSASVLPYLSVLGGLLAASLVWLFAWRGGLHAARFVLIGIGVAVALRSVVQLFLTKGEPIVAQQATVWMTGSLNGRGWEQAGPLAITLLILLPALLWAARAQRAVGVDDDTAIGLGTRLGRVRLGLAGTGVLLAAVATGAAGPVDFVALLSPQIARRLTRTAQLPLLSSALVGALLVVVADLGARQLLYPIELPVGVLTAAVGAPYLMWLIARGRTGGRA
ncbi:FecCD family ABC transporter permease [Streptomyces calidiresistens]|uniref:Iron chelate uptake ABC transporter family permease subunit n=1 Tax=Streptomyces calidiresistens TaxID=1485586 RepID=A0A7W3XY01_9ACTN|nr:iron chelate uptake ABC transporter family permease subunit [Streptomyces calidiresistens]MBB0231306.1 iron chelate uptake ABC transporter family permease subunit [Streptomyces calidiresistens]